MTIEIVDFPMKQMVDLSSSLCNKLPEGMGKLWRFGGFRTGKKLRIDQRQITRPGNLLQFAIENGPFIVDLPIKHGDFP